MAVISELKTRSKNLFNKDNIDKKNWYLNNGVPTSHVNFRSFILPCESLTEYTVQRFNTSSNPLGLAFYDEYPVEGSVATKYIRSATNKQSLTSTENSKYMVCDYFYSGQTIINEEEVINGLVVSKGTGLTEYEPYYLDITKYNNEIISNINFYGVDYNFAKNTENIGGHCDNAVEEPIIDLKIAGNSVQGKLPSKYQQVEYIEGTGTQWIDTGFIPNQDTRVIVDFQYTKLKISFVYGVRRAAATRAYTLNVRGSEEFTTAYGNEGTQNFIDFDTNRHIADKNKNMCYWDGQLVTTHEKHEFICDETLEILASYDGTNGKGYLPATAKIYSFKVYDNDVLVRDYIPCYRVSDKVAGLYDLINNTFATNSGTGEFLVGLNTPTPERPVEIESVGERTKNLFDLDLLLTHNISLAGDYYEIKNSKVTILSSNTAGWGDLNPLTLKPNTQYCLSIENIAKIDIRTPDNVKLFPNTATTTATFTTDETGLFCVKFFTTNDVYPYEIGYVQLEENSTATEYEPYGYKVPVKVSGKNLFDGTLKLGQFSWGTSTEYRRIEITLNAGTYTLSFSNTIFNQSSNIPFISGAQTFTSNTFTLTETTDCYFQFRGTDDRTENFYNSLKIQLETGNIATTYEPYINKTTNIYLNEPLRKVGDIADYIDYKNKKVVRNIKEIDISSLSFEYNATYNVFAGRINDGISYNVLGTNASYCTHYPLFVGTFGALADKTFQNPSNYWSAYNYILVKDTDYTDVTSFKNYLTVNKIMLSYILATPTEETIDVPEISTSKGRNKFSILTTIKPSEFKINYWKQIGVVEAEEEITQSGSDILIIKTGATITQSGSNLLIGE